MHQRHPEASVSVVEAGPGSFAFQGPQLLAQSEVLQDEIRPRSGERPDYLDDDRDEAGSDGGSNEPRTAVGVRHEFV